jgi:hypothetical protein
MNVPWPAGECLDTITGTSISLLSTRMYTSQYAVMHKFCNSCGEPILVLPTSVRLGLLKALLYHSDTPWHTAALSLARGLLDIFFPNKMGSSSKSRNSKIANRRVEVVGESSSSRRSSRSIPARDSRGSGNGSGSGSAARARRSRDSDEDEEIDNSMATRRRTGSGSGSRKRRRSRLYSDGEDESKPRRSQRDRKRVRNYADSDEEGHGPGDGDDGSGSEDDSEDSDDDD